jgi:hypothetical protein
LEEDFVCLIKNDHLDVLQVQSLLSSSLEPHAYVVGRCDQHVNVFLWLVVLAPNLDLGLCKLANYLSNLACLYHEFSSMADYDDLEHLLRVVNAHYRRDHEGASLALTIASLEEVVLRSIVFDCFQ